jgi:CRP-like cAMP-binding protein
MRGGFNDSGWMKARSKLGDLRSENSQRLIPFMTKRRVKAGQILFRKGQPANEMFIVTSGRLRLSEIAVDVLPGGVVGELGLLAPNQQRTQTVECIEDAQIMKVSYDDVRSIYFQNPSFGFYLLRLTSARLFHNITELEAELERRDREILRLQANATSSDCSNAAIDGQLRAVA